MKIYTTIPQDNLKKVPDVAIDAEKSGYDGLMTLENRHDPFLPLGVAAISTQHVSLLTGLAIAFPRSPMVVANIGWDLQVASSGRFVLGLGSQVRGHIERRFSIPWTAPAPKIREYINALKAIWRCWKYGDKLEFVGQSYNFSLMTPAFVPEAMAASLPPITIGAVGTGMLKVAAESCDGVRLHPFCTKKYINDVVLPIINTGLINVGKNRAHFEITGGGFIATGVNDQEVNNKLDWVRQRVAFYASTRSYWPVLEQHGLQDLGIKLGRMAKNSEWDNMKSEITDDVLDLFVAKGRYDEITTQVAQRFGGLTDAIYASTTPEHTSNLPPDLISDIKNIPQKFEVFKTD